MPSCVACDIELNSNKVVGWNLWNGSEINNTHTQYYIIYKKSYNWMN